MVASPRNHLYRTPIGANFPAFRASGKPDHIGDLPHEFDSEAVLSGTDGDTLDNTAQDLDRLRSGLRIRESLLETADFLSIDFCQVGMKSRSRRWRAPIAVAPIGGCPLLAQSGHDNGVRRCLLWGE